MKSVYSTLLAFAIGSVLLLTTTKIKAQAVAPFGCNGNYYVTYGFGADPQTPTSIDKVTYTGTGVTASLQGTATWGFNGDDINPIDGFMYGISYSNSAEVALLKIDSNAKVTVIGTLPSSVVSSSSVYSGCFDSNGDFFIGNLPDPGVASNIYKVNTATADAVLLGSTGALPDDPTGQLYFVDISIDPSTGIMYGATNYCCNETGINSKALYTIDKITGAATRVGQFETAEGATTSGYGLFFTSAGDLFLYGTDANFYLVNKSTAQITLLGSGSAYSFADGAACSYRVTHTLAVSTPFICLPDTTSTAPVAFTETFINDRGSLVTGAAYHLDLDKRFQYTQSAAAIQAELIAVGIATNSTVVTISSINGGTNNSIDISPVNIPFSGPGTKTSFVLNALFTNTSGLPSVSIASNIYNLPAIIGGQVTSDNPVTMIPNDSTKILLCNGGPLPVTFISFNAAENASGNVLVKWQTVDEVNVASYEVERSTDGINFTVLGNALATSAGSYSYTDNSAPDGKLFYRVEAIDKDGKTSFTPIEPVTSSQAAFAINVTPNPFTDNIKLQITSSVNQLAVARIYGQDGKLYESYQVNVNQGNSVASLDNTASLAPGVYAIFVNMTGTGQVFSKKIIKQ